MDNLFGSRLKVLREEYGLSQDELANMLDRNPSTISYWESGKKEPGVKVLITLSEIFNVSLDWLMGLTDERNPIAKRYYTGKELAQISSVSFQKWGVDPTKDLDYLKFVVAIKEQDITPEMLNVFMPAIVNFKKQLDENKK